VTANEHPEGLCDSPACGDCAQKRMEAGFSGAAPPATCPHCGRDMTEVNVRVTESVDATEAKTAEKPYGNVEYADPGLQEDGKARYPLSSEKKIRAAWSYINMPKNAAQYSPADWKKVRARIKAAMKKLDIPVSESSISEATTEALINGKRSFDDLRELVRKAVRTRLSNEMDAYCWVYIVDISDTDVVYMAEGDKLYQCTWSLSGDDVTLGEQVAVERTYAPLQSEDMDETATEAVTETRATVEVDGPRVLEAKGKDEKGNRIFRVLMLAYGDSKNGRRYPKSVMESAVPLYEGSKAFNRHRTEAEMRSGTVEGLCGFYRNVSAGDVGLEADFHVLPSAVLVAEALDAALSLETGEPLAGFSHDVYAKFKAVQENGRHLQEATEISSVNSVDVVAHPAAGGKATRVVAGGLQDTPSDMVSVGESTEESDVPVKREDVLAAISEATDEELVRFGLAKAGTKSTETEKKAEEAAKPEPPAVKATENTLEKGSFLGKLMVAQKVEEAQLPKPFVESITTSLPDQFTESHVDAQISAVKAALAITERAGLTPSAPKAEVTKEAHDKKVDALDAFFAKDYTKGYHSYREAVLDFTGLRPKSFDEDINRLIMQETVGAYDSSNKRASESLDTTSWAQVLGDSITRRMVKEYAQPSLLSWQAIVSSKVPVNDFRTQRVGRVGGYGTLPVVNQGAPYQPLTSPPDEEATYALDKRGGTEDITLEMIANDDVRAIQNIPSKLGLTAAQTLFRFVWDLLDTNATATYDGVALFHASHNNTASNALNQSNLSAARVAMRSQAAYGDTSNILSLTPKILVVVNDLEEIAFQLATSAVAVPSTPAGPSDTPNLHQNLQTIVVDYWTSTTKWIAIADPAMCPTIELGFYQGRELPELFTQSDPNAGSAFSADKTTFKIRHIYSGTILDHRGMYRGNS